MWKNGRPGCAGAGLVSIWKHILICHAKCVSFSQEFIKENPIPVALGIALIFTSEMMVVWQTLPHLIIGVKILWSNTQSYFWPGNVMVLKYGSLETPHCLQSTCTYSHTAKMRWLLWQLHIVISVAYTSCWSLLLNISMHLHSFHTYMPVYLWW